MQPQPAPSTGRLWPVVVVTVIVASTTVLAYLRTRPAESKGAVRPPQKSDPSKPVATPFITPGIHQPPVVQAADAKLADDVEVFGVVVEGFPRAYVVKAFSSMTAHVVNDLLGDIPVTITYSDRSTAARVFTDPKRGKPLDVKLGGFSDGMLLYAKSIFYHQESLKPFAGEDAPPFPHPTLPFQKTTWKLWRERYPDTEVYVSPPVMVEQ